MTYQLAELNIARLLAPLDSPQLQGFVDNLARINTLAESSPGYIWRLVDINDSVFGSEHIATLSVWQDVETLQQFVYRSAHTDVMKRRKEWFEHMQEAWYVLWWVPEGHRPTEQEAKQKLVVLREHGPTADAFTFKRHFAKPEVS